MSGKLPPSQVSVSFRISVRIRVGGGRIIFLEQFKVNIRKSRKKCEACSKIKHKYQNQVNDFVLVFLFLTLNTFHTFI